MGSGLDTAAQFLFDGGSEDAWLPLLLPALGAELTAAAAAGSDLLRSADDGEDARTRSLALPDWPHPPPPLGTKLMVGS